MAGRLTLPRGSGTMKAFCFSLMLLASMLSGCRYIRESLPSCDDASAVSLCDVIKQSGTLNGKQVTVRGEYQANPEYALLFSNECERSFVNIRLSDKYIAGTAGDRAFSAIFRRNPNPHAALVLRGTFKVAGIQQCFGAGCVSYELAVDEVLCARRLPPRHYALSPDSSVIVRMAPIDR